MIRSRKDYQFYHEADRIAKAIPSKFPLRRRIINFITPDYVWEFQKILRKVEYYKNCKKGIVSSVYFVFLFKRYKHLSYKLGFSIPPNVFGPGLSIAHHGTIIVNSNSRIGANCRLHACVNIGNKAGYGSKAPQIGDNCYIGPGAKIFGEIIIANNVAIGANSVVNKSFQNSNVVIAGVPARIINHIDITDILIPATIILEKNLTEEVENLIVTNCGNITRDIKTLLNGK